VLDRIAIGTANFAQEYNGAKAVDVEGILMYAKEVGVPYLDTAESYGWDYTPHTKDFKVITKVYPKQKPRDGAWGVLSHDGILTPDVDGISIYGPEEWDDNAGIIQVPYSLWDKRFEDRIASAEAVIMARSIFLRGKLLDDWPPIACLMFVLMNPNVDIVVIGTDSPQQLQHTLSPLVAMKDAGVDDLDIIDPRRWKD